MLLLDTKKFLFVDTYKTGGTSIRSALRNYRDRLGLLKILLSKLNIIKFRTYATAKQILKKYPCEWDEYFTFASVRNPWSWQVSLYFFTLQTEYNHYYEVVKSLGSFRGYIHWRVDGHKKLLTDFVFDESRQRLVDYVGRIATLRRDFDEICKLVGVEATLPHKNKSEHRGYREYYDDETRELVSEHFAPDIDAFGYSFDGIREGVQID